MDKQKYIDRYKKHPNFKNFAKEAFSDPAFDYELYAVSKKALKEAEDALDVEEEDICTLEWLDSTGYWCAVEDEIIGSYLENDDIDLIVHVIGEKGEYEAWKISADAYDPERKLWFFDTSKFSSSGEILQMIKEDLDYEDEEE